MIKVKKGFTLIELLIVIVIIGILAAIVIGIVGSSTQKRARDTKRKTAISEISKALELYFADNNEYPATIDAVTTTTPPLMTKTEAAWETSIGTEPNTITYTPSADGTTYSIEIQLENNGEKTTDNVVDRTGTKFYVETNKQ